MLATVTLASVVTDTLHAEHGMVQAGVPCVDLPAAEAPKVSVWTTTWVMWVSPIDVATCAPICVSLLVRARRLGLSMGMLLHKQGAQGEACGRC